MPDEFYGAILYWYEGPDSLGTYYDDNDDQPVTLNWRDPDLTQRTQWTHLSYEDQNFDSVLLVNEAGGRPVKPQETDSFLDRLTRHAELNTIVGLAPATLVKQATFSLDGAPSAETVKACGQQQTSSETTLYFPDFVDGGGWSVQLVLTNINTIATVPAVVAVYGQDGETVPDLFDSETSFEIPSLGNRVLRSEGEGRIRRGWIEVQTSKASVNGLLTYRNVRSGIEVGVESVELGYHFALFVEESNDIGTGLAIFKQDSSAKFELRIRDEEGRDPLDRRFVQVGDFNQRALTIPEWIGLRGYDTGFLRDFSGLLYLRTEDGSPFAPLGLRFGKRTDSLSAVPVIRIIDEDEIKPDLDLVVESASVSDTNVKSGAAFTFMATVRNRGNIASSATTLRYYRSPVARISPFAMELDTDPVSTLSASGTSDHSVSLTAPASPGTYYYGA